MLQTHTIDSHPPCDGTPWHLLALEAMLAKAARMVASRKAQQSLLRSLRNIRESRNEKNRPHNLI
jgi:hypothetical protein